MATTSGPMATRIICGFTRSPCRRSGPPPLTRHIDPSWATRTRWTGCCSTVWYRKRMEALHHAMEEADLESPFDEEWRKRWADFDQDHRVTAFVDVSGYYWVRQDALLAHATQVDPNVGFWFEVPTGWPTGWSPTTPTCSTTRSWQHSRRSTTCSPACA